MNRITAGYGVVGEALDLLSSGVRRRLARVDFLTGTHPVWAGLLESWWEKHPYEDGRVQAACSYPSHTSDRSITVILLETDWPVAVIHELGHALQYIERLGAWEALPVTPYAYNSTHEAFAEAFTARYFHYGDEAVRWQDRATDDLFSRLEEDPF